MKQCTEVYKDIDVGKLIEYVALLLACMIMFSPILIVGFMYYMVAVLSVYLFMHVVIQKRNNFIKLVSKRTNK